MNFTLNAVLSLLIGVPAVLACVRYRKTDPSFYPFLLLLPLGFVNELVSLSFVLRGETNAVNYNLYSLTEFVLLLWQFARWQAFRSRTVYLTLQGLLVALWTWESFIYANLQTFNSYYLVACSVVMVVLSINMLNRTMFQSQQSLLRNPVFLVCLGLAIICTYTILLELFWLYGLNGLTQLRVWMLTLFTVINFVVNVLFTLAVLWSPINYRYLLRSFLPAA